MLPFAVSSPSLTDGGAARTSARTTRVDELVECSAIARRRSRTNSRMAEDTNAPLRSRAFSAGSFILPG